MFWQLHRTSNPLVACGLLSPKFIFTKTALHSGPAYSMFWKFCFTQISCNCIEFKVGSTCWHHLRLSFQLCGICHLMSLTSSKTLTNVLFGAQPSGIPQTNSYGGFICHKLPREFLPSTSSQTLITASLGS